MMPSSKPNPTRIERFHLSPPQTQRPLDPDTDQLISRIVELEISSGLSSRGAESYRSIANDPAHLILIARAGTELVGIFAACIVMDELQIDNLAVSSLYRGKGIGSRLVAAGLSIGRRHSCQIAILEVRSANLPARTLYLKAGFEEVGKRPRYYQNPPDDAITMLCQL